MNIALWIVQVLLAARYGMAGSMKLFQTAKAREQLPWAKNRSDGFVRFVGTSEMLGALGLILPGLTLIQLLAIFTEHLPKKEYKVIPVNILLLALAVFVAIGRWTLFS